MSRSDARSAAHLTPPVEAAAVTSDDLRYVDEISALLFTLNDPRASAGALARHVDKIRVLKVRIARRYMRVFAKKAVPETTQQIALLGNRELEVVLLELLEDIVSYPDGAGSGIREI
jgi:hypothetical protein